MSTRATSHHTVALGIVHLIRKNRGSPFAAARASDSGKPCPKKMLSPRIRDTRSLPMKSAPIGKACARPSGFGCCA